MPLSYIGSFHWAVAQILHPWPFWLESSADSGHQLLAPTPVHPTPCAFYSRHRRRHRLSRSYSLQRHLFGVSGIVLPNFGASSSRFWSLKLPPIQDPTSGWGGSLRLQNLELEAPKLGRTISLTPRQDASRSWHDAYGEAGTDLHADAGTDSGTDSGT
jgi:hypothetical protein